MICKEPDQNNHEKLVLTGIATRNMLSNYEGKPGVYARIFEQKSWIENVISTWSEWTSCDSWCSQARRRYCKGTELNCYNNMMKETQKCKSNLYEDVALDGHEENVI